MTTEIKVISADELIKILLKNSVCSIEIKQTVASGVGVPILGLTARFLIPLII